MALIDRSIRLVERGTPAIVSEADWQLLNLEETCRPLIEKKVIGLKRVGDFRVLEPRQFVGHLRLPGRAIVISPHSRELFNALHKFVASPPEKSVQAKESSTTAQALHPVDVALAFVRAFESVVNIGLPFSYERVTLATTHPRGRLLVNETVRSLHSRGVSHQVFCSVTERQYDRALGSVLATVVSMLKASHELPARVSLGIDQLMALFDDSAQILATQKAKENVGMMLSTYSDQSALVRLLEICRAILSYEEVIWDTQIPIPDGECRFCNMDRLWELSVLTAFRKSRASLDEISVEFHPFSSSHMNLLVPGGPRIDPDVVVFKNGLPFIVLDAKYTETTSASAPDVYQIVCYAQRLKAAKGVLVYMSSERNWFRSLGRTKEGILIDAIGVTGGNDVDLNLVSLADKVFSSERLPFS